jgi:hypothetical protein
VSEHRWVDRSQPQTLMMATMLLYINAAFSALSLITGASVIGVVFIAGQVAAGFGIANEKKWGYWLGVALVAVLLAYVILSFHALAILSLLIYGAMLALLLHPQSREYRKVWFR